MSNPAESSVADTRNRLIQAAREAFMTEGYRASVDSIAARAGVAKQTLYNHFPSKDELFSESVGLVSAAIVVTLDGQTDDVRATLLRFGATFRQNVHGTEGLAMFRTLMAEAARFPTLALPSSPRGRSRPAPGWRISLGGPWPLVACARTIRALPPKCCWACSITSIVFGASAATPSCLKP